MAKIVDEVLEVAFHRNGICGRGFYAVRFLSTVEGKGKLNFLATLTDDPGECYVICTDLLPTCGVKFAGGNSWRGDHYEDELREAIKNYGEKTSGSVRVGPFAIPIA